jgi:hypothetical protein
LQYCSAGIGRTGKAASYIELSSGSTLVDWALDANSAGHQSSVLTGSSTFAADTRARLPGIGDLV